MSYRQKLFNDVVAPDLIKLIDICRQHGMAISCTVVYEEITYDGALVGVETAHGYHFVDTEHVTDSAYFRFGHV